MFYIFRWVAWWSSDFRMVNNILLMDLTPVYVWLNCLYKEHKSEQLITYKATVFLCNCDGFVLNGIVVYANSTSGWCMGIWLHSQYSVDGITFLCHNTQGPLLLKWANFNFGMDM